MVSKKIKLGEPIELEFHPRYFQHNRGHAIRDVYDALVELITNSDDSYHRLFEAQKRAEDGGQILIEISRKRNEPSLIRVKDRAEGMTMDDMVRKMGHVGNRQSGIGDRGFMARGAKDCTELGEMKIESVKDNKYYACRLTPGAEFIPEVDGEKVTAKVRKSLGIRRQESGTTVTLFVENATVHLASTFLRDLPWHYALRLICYEESPTQVYLKDINKSTTDPVVFRFPEGKKVVDEDYMIDGYPEARANFKLWKSAAAFENPTDRRLRRSGVLIKGTRAVFECTLLATEFENDPLAQHYFGVLECPYIDNLLEEYDTEREKGERHHEANPKLVIDPNRQSGMLKEHPFTKALFQKPSEKLRSLIAKDREAQGKRKSQIANRETRRRLDKLARLAAEFLQEQVDDLEEGISSGEPDSSALEQKGVAVVPSFVRLIPGQKKQFWVYMKSSLTQEEAISGTLQYSSDTILLPEEEIELIPHPKKADRLFGKFLVEAMVVGVPATITVSFPNLPSATAEVEVVEEEAQFRDFESPLEFGFKNYTVKHGSTRTLKLFALFPEVVSQEVSVKVWSDQSSTVEVLGSATLVPVADSNFAQAEVRVSGRTLNDKSVVHAQIHGRNAHTLVKVVEKPKGNVPIKIELREQNFGHFRAKWADYEGQPNLLLISSIHPSIKRYLGPGPEFEGQNSPVFRLLMAEIVAESICRRLLTLAAKERPWEFNLAELKKDRAIVDTVIAHLHRALREFVSVAHEAMLSNSEF